MMMVVTVGEVKVSPSYRQRNYLLRIVRLMDIHLLSAIVAPAVPADHTPPPPRAISTRCATKHGHDVL